MLTFKIFYNELNKDEIYIRKTVFVKEQGFKEEFDNIDYISTHVLAYLNNIPVGCGRFYFDKTKNQYFIGRLAILKQYRKEGMGSKIIFKLEDELKKINVKKVYLASQKRAIDFYIKCGYKKEGNFFLEEKYPHILMYKNLE